MQLIADQDIQNEDDDNGEDPLSDLNTMDVENNTEYASSFDLEKRPYTQLKELFNDLLQDVGDNESLQKEIFERLEEHVSIPVRGKIRRLNEADHRVGGVRSLGEEVNRGLPSSSARTKPSWELSLEHGRSKK